MRIGRKFSLSPPPSLIIICFNSSCLARLGSSSPSFLCYSLRFLSVFQDALSALLRYLRLYFPDSTAVKMNSFSSSDLLKSLSKSFDLLNSLSSFNLLKSLSSFDLLNFLSSFDLLKSLSSFDLLNFLSSFDLLNSLSSFDLLKSLSSFDLLNFLSSFDLIFQKNYSPLCSNSVSISHFYAQIQFPPNIFKGPIHDQKNSQYFEAKNGRPIFDKIFDAIFPHTRSIKIWIKIYCVGNVWSGCCRCRSSGFG